MQSVQVGDTAGDPLPQQDTGGPASPEPFHSRTLQPWAENCTPDLVARRVESVLVKGRPGHGARRRVSAPAATSMFVTRGNSLHLST